MLLSGGLCLPPERDKVVGFPFFLAQWIDSHSLKAMKILLPNRWRSTPPLKVVLAGIH